MSAARWACVVAALGAAAYLLLEPASADLAAQLYRAELVRDHGLGVWNNGWFAGHHTPAYSVLFPPLGALIGVRLAGALAAVVAAALFALIAQARWGPRAGSAAAAWFAAGAVAMLLSGRLTFLFGGVFALAAALALQRDRRVLAAAFAVLTALASPVAALFLALAALAWALAGAARERALWGALIAACALAPAAALAALFPEGGSEPFVASAFWPALAGTVLVAVVLPARERALRAGAALYALTCVAAFAVATPLGGNVTRLGALLAGPVLLGALLGRGGARSGASGAARTGGSVGAGGADRGGGAVGGGGAARGGGPVGAGGAARRGGSAGGGAARGARVSFAGTPLTAASSPRLALLALLALGLAYWQAYPAVRDVARASDDPSTTAAYHAPLLRYLERRPDAGGFRVEIPFTENHWEAAHVAPTVALARGWERQLDRRYGALFYDGELDAARYRAWLDEHAVAYVALPDVPLDYAARDEARLIAGGLPYLKPVWRDAHWRVYAVRRRAPLVERAAGTARMTPGGFIFDALRRGDALVRVRHTRWWRVSGGRACVERAPGGMTRVRVLEPGVVRVRAGLSGSRCRR